jgi:membrane protein required for colicin V production
MPITIFDGIVIGVILFSAVLAMVRGFSREILSIVSWGGSAVAAYYLYSLLVPYALHYTADTLIALIIISFITIRIADFIIDSRIGALDRTLGFLFGAARGLLLMVVVVAFWNWLVAPPARPEWVNSAKSKPFLDSLVEKLKSALPENIQAMLPAEIINKIAPNQQQQQSQPQDGGDNGTTNDTAPSDDAPAPQTNN